MKVKNTVVIVNISYRIRELFNLFLIADYFR